MQLTKEKKQRLILVGVGTIAAVVGIYYGMVGAAKRQLVLAVSDRDAARSKLAIAETAVRNLDRLRADVKVVTNALEQVEAGMVSADDPLSWAYRLLQDLQTNHRGVVIAPEGRPNLGVAGTGLSPGFSYTNAVFSMKGSATYEDLGKFLADFENRFPYFHVQDLTVYSSVQGTGAGEAAERKAGQVQFTMKLVALVKPSQ